MTNNELIDIIDSNEEIWGYRVFGESLYFLLRWHIHTHIAKCNFDNGVQVESRNRHHFPGLLVCSFLKDLKLEISNRRRRRSIDSNYKNLIGPASIQGDFLFLSTGNRRINPNYSMDHVELHDLVYYFSNYTPINYVQYATNLNGVRNVIYNSYNYINALSTKKISIADRVILFNFLVKLEKIVGISFLDSYFSYLHTLESFCASIQQIDSMLKPKKIKYIFTVSIYTEPWILVASKRLNIKVVEMQHGILQPFYYGTILNNIDRKRYGFLFPDYILCHGNYWKKYLIDSHSNWNEKNTLVIGSKEYSIAKNKRQSRDFKITKIKYFTQNNLINLDSYFFNFVKMFRDIIESKKMQIIVRVHPDYNGIDKYLQFSKDYNFVLIENAADMPSFFSICESDIVLAATSTCLYEALSLDVKAISHSSFKNINLSDKIEYFDSLEGLYNLIFANVGRLCLDPINQFFSSFNTTPLQGFLNKK